MKRKLISIGMKLLLSLAAVVLAIAAGELIVRALYPEYGIPVFTTKLLTEFDPLLGWRKIPNFRGAHVQDEYAIVEQINSKELLFFQSEGKKYEPDLVIVLYYANDAPMNIKPYYGIWNRGQKPLFELVDGKLSLKSKPKKTWDREEEAAKDLAKNEHEYKQAFALTDLQTWYLYRLYKHVRTRGRENVINELPVDQDAQNRRETDQSPSPGSRYRGRQQEWVMTEALMAKLKKEASSVDCEFLLYYVPLKNEVYSGSKRTSPHEYNLQAISSRHDIRFIPTLETFRKQAELLENSGKRLYWKKDSHWTPEGHHLTGLILAEHILAHQPGVRKDDLEAGGGGVPSSVLPSRP